MFCVFCFYLAHFRFVVPETSFQFFVYLTYSDVCLIISFPINCIVVFCQRFTCYSFSGSDPVFCPVPVV